MPERLNGGGTAAKRAAVPPRAAALRLVALTAVAVASTSCNLLNDDQDLPDVARVQITGTSPEALELVVSDDFERVSDLDQGTRYTVLVQADTSFVLPNFFRDYDIEASHRFFVRLTNHSFEVAEVTLSVAFDRELRYTQRANLSEGGALEFSEIFFGT